MHLGRSHLQRHHCASQTVWLAPEPRAQGGSQHHLLFLFLLQAPGAAQPWCCAPHFAIQPQGAAGEEGGLHFAVEQFLQAKEPGKHSIPYLHILSISQPEPSPSTTTDSSFKCGARPVLVYPPRGKCLWGRTAPGQVVGHLGAPVHRSSRTKKSQARGAGRGGERNTCSDV